MATFFAGDLPGGAALLERAPAGYRVAGDALLVFDTLILLAAVHFFLDDQRGEAAAAEALALTEQHGARWSRGYALWAVAVHRWRAGAHRATADLLREAIALRLADRTLLAFLVEALAWCGSSAGEHERAARLLGCATAVWRLSGARVGEMSPYQSFDEQCADQAREALGAEAFDAAFAKGAGLRLDEQVSVAVSVTSPVRLGLEREILVPRPLPVPEEDEVTIDSRPQPCPRCHRPTVLVSYSWGRQWTHVGTWRPQCGAPVWESRRLMPPRTA